MLVVCTLLLARGKDIPVITNVDVEGKILKESQQNYLVDFSESIKNLETKENPNDFKKKLVNKSVCVKE